MARFLNGLSKKNDRKLQIRMLEISRAKPPLFNCFMLREKKLTTWTAKNKETVRVLCLYCPLFCFYYYGGIARSKKMLLHNIGLSKENTPNMDGSVFKSLEVNFFLFTFRCDASTWG